MNQSLDLKPQVYRYHDYRSYLSDVISFFKAKDKSFSLRSLCKSADVSVTFFSMVLSEQRNLTEGVLKKIAKKLKIESRELTYLTLLMQLTDSDSPEERIQALKKLQKFSEYQSENKKELEVFSYLTKWYYVAIRELANLDGFKEDVVWIQKTLSPKLTPVQIREALDYLKAEEFLVADKNGRLVPSEKIVDCLGGIFRLSLSQYHSQMFQHAVDSIHKNTREERTILGHTFCVSIKGYEEISQLMSETLKKVQDIELKDSEPERLYHVSLAAFPLSEKVGDDE